MEKSHLTGAGGSWRYLMVDGAWTSVRNSAARMKCPLGERIYTSVLCGVWGVPSVQTVAFVSEMEGRIGGAGGRDKGTPL